MESSQKNYEVGDIVNFYPFGRKDFKTKIGEILSKTTVETKDTVVINYTIDVGKDMWIVDHESII